MTEHRPQVTYYRDEVGGWRWHLRGGNGEIVATGESHTRREDAERAFEGVADLATKALGRRRSPLD